MRIATCMQDYRSAGPSPSSAQLAGGSGEDVGSVRLAGRCPLRRTVWYGDLADVVRKRIHNVFAIGSWLSGFVYVGLFGLTCRNIGNIWNISHNSASGRSMDDADCSLVACSTLRCIEWLAYAAVWCETLDGVGVLSLQVSISRRGQVT